MFIDLCVAQNISGIVKDSSAKPISNAFVTLIRADSISILNYSITDSNGKFLIKIDNINNISFIRITAIGYKSIFKTLPRNTDSLQFILYPLLVALDEVKVIEQRAIIQNSDTLSYNVSSFTKPMDSNIEDVLKKLPGIEVKEGGQIFYQGKPINKFYIDNADITGNNYNLATKTLPPDIVDKIEILENFQAINALKGLFDDERASLNLKLKPSAKVRVTGTGKTGFGLGDSRLADFNFFLFKNRLKYLNVFNYNNNIIKLSPLLTDFGSINKIQNNNLPFQKLIFNNETYLNNMADERWQLNHSGLLSTNTVFKLHQNGNLKLNASYLPEYFTSQTNNSKNYQIGNFKYTQFEKKSDSNLNQQANLNLEYELNEKKSYLLNKINFNLSKKKYDNSLYTDIGYYSEGLKISSPNFQNNFSLIRPIKEDYFLKFDSHLGYLSSPEELAIYPGIESITLKIDSSYKSFTQSLVKETYFLDNKLSLIIKKKNLTKSFIVSHNLEYDVFGGKQFAKDSLGITKALNPNNISSFDWRKNVYTFDSKFVFAFDKANISIDLPLSLRTQNYLGVTDTFLNQKKQYLFISPLFNIKYGLSSNQELNILVKRNKDYGKADNIINGLIAENYRSTSSRPYILPDANSLSYNFSYAYKNALKMFFANAGAFLINTSQNTIININYNDNGTLNTSMLDFNNKSSWYAIYSNVSKYLFNIKTLINLDLSINQINKKQNQNELILNSKNNNLNMGLGLISQPNEILEINYKSALVLSNAKNSNFNSTNNLKNFSQKLTLVFSATESLNIRPSFNWFILNNGLNENQTILLDFDTEYSSKKNNLKIGISIANLLSNPKYFEKEVGLNSNIESTYYLKPQTIFPYLKFRF